MAKPKPKRSETVKVRAVLQAIRRRVSLYVPQNGNETDAYRTGIYTAMHAVRLVAEREGKRRG